MANSLLKTTAHNSFADGIYSGIISKSTHYYYFIGKTVAWNNEAIPSTVIDSRAYERECRNEIIAAKEITPSDVSYVIPRVNWATGTVYDNYDDQYSSEIQGLNLLSGGTAYVVLSPPTIEIGTLVPVNTNIIANTQYFYNGYLYTVKTGGQTGANNTVLLGILGADYAHGAAVLTCVGIQATATCTVGNNLKIATTTMINRGYGYITIPTVTFSGGTASATAVIKNGVGGTQKLENTNYYVYSDSGTYICISNNNGLASTIAPTGITSNYLTTADGYVWKYMSSITADDKFITNSYIPIYTTSKNQYNATGSISSVYVDNVGSGYVSATGILPLSTSVTLTSKYLYNGFVYTVTIAGTTGSSYTGLGTTTNTSYTSGAATLLCNGPTTSITVLGDGTGASLIPLITNGAFSGVQVLSGGTQYSYANLVINGVGTGASLSASLFTNIPSYSQQASSEDGVIQGNICSIQMVSGGYGYDTGTVISIVGDGTDATATATILNNNIISINLTNRGKNYNWANIVITDTVGTGAIARAVLSPRGGLGKDPINNFEARTLMLYAKISDNTNQGIAVYNNYRQVGILKDPTRYSDGIYASANFITTCWKVTATATINVGIVVDDIVTTVSNSIVYRFRVIGIIGSDALLIPLDNGIPTNGMQFSKTSLINFITSKVLAPTLDKYSGDLLFIDNESTFIATVDSPAILRTVINF
jgi:hypothetical protein